MGRTLQLSYRAIHIEVMEELSSSAFTNALTQFISIRGAVKKFRSNRGTNSIGALDHINVDAIYVESGPVKKFLSTNGRLILPMRRIWPDHGIE